MDAINSQINLLEIRKQIFNKGMFEVIMKWHIKYTDILNINDIHIYHTYHS